MVSTRMREESKPRQAWDPGIGPHPSEKEGCAYAGDGVIDISCSDSKHQAGTGGRRVTVGVIPREKNEINKLSTV